MAESMMTVLGMSIALVLMAVFLGLGILVVAFILTRALSFVLFLVSRRR